MKALTVENAMDYLYGYATDGVGGGLHSACMHVLRDDRFAWAPGSKGKHHAFRGGLALHTAEVVRNCLLLGQNLDWPVLLTAAIWHDYMKVKEYEMHPAADGGWVITSPPYRDLIGHVTGSVIELHALCAKGEFQVSDAQLDGVTHCMLAHHGRLEWRSPVEPQTPEAWVLHAADMMSARCLAQQSNRQGDCGAMIGEAGRTRTALCTLPTGHVGRHYDAGTNFSWENEFPEVRRG